MTYQSVVLSDNPLVYFRLGETAGTTASDLSGNSRHGTISGSPAPTLGVAGALVGDSDKAMAFAGSRIDLAAASWMQVGTYSVEAWVNPSSVASGQIAIAGRHSVSGQQWDLLRNGSNIEWRTKDSGNTTVYTAVASGVLAVGSWTHVVGTYDGANLRLYINGVLKHTVACSSTLNAAGTSNVLSVAALSSNYANIPWAGSLDEFAYYGTALSAARVASHYVAGTSAYASTVLADTPLAYYRLGETSGTTMLDSSGNSRNGEYDLGGVILGADGLLTGDPNKAIDIKTVSVTGRPGRVDYASWMDLPTFSVEVMFNADSVAAGAKTLVSRYNSTGANDMTYSVRLDGDTVVFYRGIGTAFASVVSSVPVTIGTVHHVVATYDGTTARLYLDGALVGSAAQAAHNVTNQRINIGSAGSAGGGNERFDGRIDEVAIYGTALSGSRVAAHSDASKGVTSAPAVTASLTGTGTFTATVTSTAVTSSYSSVVLADTPTAYYRLGEPAMATQMLDSSGNARHGTYDYTTNPDLPVTGFPGLVDDADTAFRTTISNQGGSAPLSTPVEPFTVDAVIKMPDTAADDTVVIAKRTGQFEFRARWYSTAENPRVMLLSLTYDTDPGGGTTTTTVQSTAMARSKGPMHVAVTHDPGAGYGTNSTTTFYVNGQQVDGSYSSAPRRTDLAVPAGTPLQIGRKIGGEIGAVYLDEVSFYSGKMLTAARIAVHAAQIPAFITANLSGGGLFTATVVPVQARTVVLTGSGSFTATATRVIEATTPWAIAVTSLSPFLWAEFNEASGNTANDSSANGRHGSYSNVVQNQQGLVPGHPGSKAWATSSILSYVTFGSGSLNFPARGSTYVLTYKGTDSANTGRLFTTFSSNTYLDISGTVEMSIGGVKPTLSPVWDPTPLYDGNPHLIVYVVNTTTAELWVDGVMVTSGTHAAAASNLPYVRPKTDSAGPLGTYDEFVLYSSPLTAQQIGTLWTAWQGTPAPAVTASLTGTGTFTATSRAVGAYEGAVLADAPVAYWRMGDTSGTTMADSSGNGRNGTYSNVTLGAAGLLVGDADTSADFNGLTTSSTSGASVPSASWMNPASRSIEAIFRLDALPTTSTATIVARNDPSSGSSQSWQLAIWNDSGTSRPFFHVYDSTGAVIANPTISASVVTGVTYHAVVTYDGATVRVYLNGALVGSAALVAGFRDNGQPITIGRLTGSTFYPFDGRIDEVAIYPTALPASRIVAHYAVSTGIPAVNAPLVGVGSFTATSTQVTLVDNAYDNFNRADLPALTGSLSESGHTWLASSYGAFPSAGIATNRATCNVRDSVDVIETGRTIGEVSIRYIAGQWPAVYARESATGRYRVEVGSGTWYLERDDASTILASWPSTLSSGDVIGLQVETVGGNTVLTVKKNGSALGTYTDSSANQRTGTRFGFSVGLAGGTVDDFSYTSAPVGAVAPQVTAPLVGTGAFTATARKAGPLVAKFDASAITGLVDGDPVVTWVDSVGTSDLTQATSASRPVYRTGVLNGLPVVRFDATDFMDSAVRAVGKYATIVVVAKLEAGSGTRVLAWNGDGNQGSAGPIVSSGNRGLYLRWVAIQTDGAATSNWERWIMPIGASAQKLFVDGTKVVDGSGAMSAVGAGYFRVGGSDGGPEFTSGGMDVAEVRVYDTVLTDAEVAAVDAELAAKWFGVAPTPAVNAPIVGMGVLSATVRKVVSVAAPITGSGAFTATALVAGATPPVAAALTGVGAFTATSVALQLGDSRSNPFIIGGVGGELTLDMVNMTTESGESLAPGVTRTVWLHYSPPDSSGESVRFLTDSPASVRVYDSGGTLVASDDSGAASLVLPWGTYEIQVGTSTPDSVILEWLDATPMPYNDFANALEINPDYGSEYLTLVNGTVEPGETVPPGTVATSWVTWVAEDTTTLNLTSAGDPADTSYSLIAYSGSPLGEAGSVSGSGQLALAIDMVEGQTYWLQIASSTDLLDVQLVWNIDPVIVEPSQDAESIRAEVYERDGVTLITEVPKRFGVNLQEPLNVTGAGSLSVRIGDETVSMYPDLFDFGNVVKFWLGTRCIHGFRIQNRKTAWVSTDEWSGMVRTVSGPSVHYLLEDFMVLHDAQKLQDRASDVRSFNWAARRGEWYNAEDWDGPYNTSSQLEPPSEFSKPFKKRAKYNNPKNWPDPDALWMWVSNDPSLNEGNFDPPPLRKTRYFRKQFTTGDPYQLVRMYASADEKYQVYLDGEEILSGDGVETGYTEMQKKKLVLKSGVHTLAIVQTSQNQTKADGADAVIFSLMKLDTKGRPTDAIVRSDDSWETTYLRPAPGWNRAQVLRAVVNEAKNRNNNSANHLSLGFTKDRDSRNRRWLDTFNEDVSIGTSALALQGMLSESGSFDVWVDPVNLEIKAWRRRGRDMSHSVTLEPGRNLINWEVEEVDNVKNRFLIQYDGGWTNWAAKYSVQVYGDREAFLTIGKAKNDEAAERIVRRASRGLAQAQARAGTSEIVKRKEGTPTGGMIAVPGARPFLDFGVGDTIKAPNARGILKPHRVLAITLTEDENGEITYDPELEEVR